MLNLLDFQAELTTMSLEKLQETLEITLSNMQFDELLPAKVALIQDEIEKRGANK